MRAVVFTDEGEKILTVPDPTPAADEVLVEVEFCGICGSDLHAAGPDFHTGTTMGHEFSGTVVETGTDVTGWKPGDRVCINPNGDWCGTCDSCKVGAFNTCPQIWETAVGLVRPGGLAPIAPVRSRVLRRLPDEVSLRQGAWVEPLAVAIRAVHLSGLRLGDDALVFGGGPIGLLVTALLRAAGARRITVAEPSPTRREVAGQLGADRVVDPFTEDLASVIAADGPLRFAFECTGVAEVTGQAVSLLAPRGRLTVNGFARRPPSYDAAELLIKEIEVRGSFIYVEEFEQAISALASGFVDVEPLISGVVSLEDATTAFSAMRSSTDALKYLISPKLDAAAAGS